MKQHLAHTILTELCKVRNLSSSVMGNEEPVTPRVTFIVDTLLDMGLGDKLHADVYEDSFVSATPLFYMNMEVTFDMGTDTSVMYIAHHDVNNINSDNCQDNSASVSNLLALAEHFNENPPEKTVHIVFTDCEEFGGEGSARLADRILEGVFGEVEYVVNLELTANGRNLWCDSGNFTTESPLLDLLREKGEFYGAKTPFNDSYILRNKGRIDSVCIGTLDEANLAQVQARGYCGTWALCHRMEDTIAQGNADDMDNFVEFLTELV